MSWICTFTGKRFYPMGPNPSDIDIVDVAHALGNMCRYTGHVSEFWSVAAHSIEVSRRVEEICRDDPGRRYPNVSVSGPLSDSTIAKYAMTGLLHDAGEAYLVDIPRPIKPLFLNYREWSDALDEAVSERFGTFFPHPNVVTIVDGAMLTTEIRQFFQEGSEAWKRHGVTRATPCEDLIPLAPSMSWGASEGRSAFLRRFWELEERMR